MSKNRKEFKGKVNPRNTPKTEVEYDQVVRLDKDASQTAKVIYNGCTFNINIPTNFSLAGMFNGDLLDKYKVSMDDMFNSTITTPGLREDFWDDMDNNDDDTDGEPEATGEEATCSCGEGQCCKTSEPEPESEPDDSKEDIFDGFLPIDELLKTASESSKPMLEGLKKWQEKVSPVIKRELEKMVDGGVRNTVAFTEAVKKAASEAAEEARKAASEKEETKDPGPTPGNDPENVKKSPDTEDDFKRKIQELNKD